MSLLAVPIISVIALLLALIALVLIFSSNRRLKQTISSLQVQSQSSQLLLDELQVRISQETENTQIAVDKLNQATLENDQVTKQLEHRIKVQQEQHQELRDYIESLQSQAPEDKLYSRASKLVALGADIEEIMRECDIPRAEAEMLMSVHAKRKIQK